MNGSLQHVSEKMQGIENLSIIIFQNHLNPMNK
jgi:hypothetical protein